MDQIAGESRPSFSERHYSVSQVAQMWGLSDDSVRRLFEKEQGVLVMAENRRGTRRLYRTLRIPATVVERVHERLSAG